VRVSAPFEAGERVLFLDSRQRRYLVRLEGGGTFHYHRGALPHDLVIGSEEGTIVRTTAGEPVVCFRPRLSDYVLKMRRGAQVIYPKDLGPMLVYADIFPGSAVLEAGTGSGALTLALCRVVGPEGRVVSYEVRPEFMEVARQNVETFFGKIPPWLDLRVGDVGDAAVAGEAFDRILLDLPEPWNVLHALDRVLPPGGILAAYLPTTNQTQSLAVALSQGPFAQVETFEVLLRTWHVAERSVRPDHRMVAHTGFITVARRIAD
jgi:tRNA (adenine57-N1/adenine58-N1)-methyltransferase